MEVVGWFGLVSLKTIFVCYSVYKGQVDQKTLGYCE